jgi:putative sigma-54 modulation protein
MKITITARHFEASADLKSHIESHLEDAGRFLDKVIGATVILSVEKYRHRAEIIVESSGRKFVSEAVADDMYKSVDECVEKLKVQLKRSKEKLKDHKGASAEPVADESTDR